MELAEKVEFNSQLRQILQADGLQDSSGREGTMFFSSLPLPPAQKHSEIYLQLCMWDDYDVFLISSLVTTRPLDSMRFTTLLNYHLFDWWGNVNFYFRQWFDSRFCYSNLTPETGELSEWTMDYLSPLYHPCTKREPTNQMR